MWYQRVVTGCSCDACFGAAVFSILLLAFLHQLWFRLFCVHACRGSVLLRAWIDVLLGKQSINKKFRFPVAVPILAVLLRQ
jgi:hypothetical protein